MSLDQIIDDVLNPPKEAFGAGKEEGEQGSVGWLMERVGYCTASRFKDVMDFRKDGKPGAKRIAYHWELVIERLTGRPVDHYTNAAMEHGIQNEPVARMAYESFTGNIVTQTGFHKHPEIPFVGGSPDGLVDDDGGVEIKSPFNAQHHLQAILTGIPEEHIAQVQGLMWIHGRNWWDFVSHSPNMPPEFQIYVQRIEFDAEYVEKLSAAVTVFLAEVDATLAKLKEGIQ